ncbi:hypothetical protein BH09BAC6_BH09BAC6_30420 [soil metagenome]
MFKRAKVIFFKVNLIQQYIYMETLTIDKKASLLLSKKNLIKFIYLPHKIEASQKKTYVAAGKTHAYKMIDKWAKGK